MSNPNKAPPPAEPVLGIDLGTTYSVVAHVDSSGRPVTLLNSVGEPLTPSVVAFDDDGVVVGREAMKSGLLSPDTYAECFKRDMGRSCFRRPLRQCQVPAEVLSALVLERLKLDAQQRLGPVRKAVITVPAFFDETRRRATMVAGRLAGLEVLDIINEPTAAAIALSYQRAADRGKSSDIERILVYDLGGGTFDVTILEIDGQTLRTLATDGDVQLGGKDFDERLVDHLAEEFLATHGLDPRADPCDAVQLWRDAQEAKHELTHRTRTGVVSFHAGIRMRQEVTRIQFEELTQDLLERTRMTTGLVVKQAGLDWDHIDHVLLVGGATRMPMVIKMLRELTGREPDCSQSPDQAVAHGAALYARTFMPKSPQAASDDFTLINVNSHSLGVVGTDVRSGERINVVLIPKNTPLPCRKSRVFQTAKPNQASVKVAVVEGESTRPDYCIALGRCVIRDLPPNLPQGTPIEVEYSYAADGTLSVAARIPSVRQSASVEITRQRSALLDGLDVWRKRLSRDGQSSEVLDSVPKAAAKISNSSTAAADERARTLGRLDELYVQFGEQLAGRPAPQSLRGPWSAAQEAATALNRARQEYQQLQALEGSAVGRAETVHLTSARTRARQTLRQAETCCRFAYLVLGRECSHAEVTVPSDTALRDEIARLESQLRP